MSTHKCLKCLIVGLGLKTAGSYLASVKYCRIEYGDDREKLLLMLLGLLQ
ncbi:hypothetical protein YC2023_005859 [Brassica napus]